MKSYSYNLNPTNENSDCLSLKRIAEAIFSPKNYSSVSFLSHSALLPSSQDKTKSSDAYTPFNTSLHERGANIKTNTISHSRFHHASPPNNIKTDGISYYYLPDNSFQKQKKTLVLDLDETLVHSLLKKPFIKPDYVKTIEFNNQYYPIYVSTRPFLEEFLEKMAKKYVLVLFSASIPRYGNMIVDTIDPKKLISYRLYREHCTKKANCSSYRKELKRLGRDLKDVIILDNNPVSYDLNKDNALPIEAWLNDKTDRELLKLVKVLDFLAEENDVRPVIQKVVDRHNKIDYNVVNSLIYKRNKQFEGKAVTMTYQLNNSSDNEREAKKQNSFSKIQYPLSFNGSFRQLSSADNKIKKIKDNMMNEFKIKRNYDKNNTSIIILSQHSPMKKMTQKGKRSCNSTLNEITQMRKEIEQTKKYFVNVN